MNERMKGFPLWQMTVLLLIRFAEPISFTSLFPYVYFMIRDFGIAEDKTQISRYSGYLAAAFSLTQFFCCIHWGRLSDRIGRKPVIMTGLIGSSISILTFGFSKNYYMAVAARAAMGALNGNIAVLQTLVGEVVTNPDHQPLAFSMIPFLWNLGCVIGPLIGGSKYLTRPRQIDTNNIGDGFYERFMNAHPYALSNIVVASLLLFSASTAFLFLEETHQKARYRYDVGLTIGDWMRARLGYKIPIRPWMISRETQPLLEPVVSNSLEESDTPRILSRRTSEAIVRRYLQYSLARTTSNVSITEETKSLLKALRNREIFLLRVIGTMAAYFSISFHLLAWNEFMPVLLAGEFQRDSLVFPWRMKGGFQWTTLEIGQLLSVVGIGGCLVILVIFPFLDRNVKTINGFRFACAMFPIAYFIVPYLVFLTPGYSSYPEWVSRTAVYANACILVLGSALAFPQIVILLFRVTKPKYRGFVNSTTMSLTSLARFIAPIAYGSLMLICDKHGIGQLAWNLLAILGLAGFALAMALDEYNEDQNTEIET